MSAKASLLGSLHEFALGAHQCLLKGSQAGAAGKKHIFGGGTLGGGTQVIYCIINSTYLLSGKKSGAIVEGQFQTEVKLQL